jgi:DNA-binding XRE family transcriptional regulator
MRAKSNPKPPAREAGMGRKPGEPKLDTYTGRFGARLRELRVKRGKTTEELAAAIGVATSTLYGWENGSRSPEFAQLPQLAEALGVTVRHLMPEK